MKIAVIKWVLATWLILSGHLEAQPTPAEAHRLRAVLSAARGDFDGALRGWTQALAIEPNHAPSYQARGAAHFKRGNVRQSVADFDKYLELQPQERPGHWMRGISLYYAGQFAEGRKQFEGYERVDTNDVENAVWHFLCLAREEGVDKARQRLLKIGNDARVPMMTVYALFRGEAKPEDVLAAAQRDDVPAARRQPSLFYAHLYLGLYHEILGDQVKALEHVRQALKNPIGHYMYDVARVHLALRSQGPWDLEALRTVPTVESKDAGGGVQVVHYVNELHQGKPTRLFGYLARPEKANGKLPAMVLVRGGGGTAFREWAELWAKRGYVALAMDLAGVGQDKKRLPDGGPPQNDDAKFRAGDNPKDYWTYHAVAAVIRGISLLAAQPDVDHERLGITGISWGGYLTCIVAGLDDRLKVAVPVYGCGFIHENSAWLPIFARMQPAERERWITHFEPSRYLPQARMPMLFVNGTNDFAYPLDSYQKSYNLVANHQVRVTVNLPHGHKDGWTPPEIGLFVDQHLKQGRPLPRILKTGEDGEKIALSIDPNTPVKEAALHFTPDVAKPWVQRKWQTVTATMEDASVSATLPTERPIVYFLTVKDDRGATVSTPHVVVPKP